MPRKTAKGSQLFRQATKWISKMTAHPFRQNWGFLPITVNFHRSCRPPQEKWPTVLFAQGPTFSPCRLFEPGPNLGWESCLLLCLESAEFKSLWTLVCILLSKSLPGVPIQSRLLIPSFHLITPWAKSQTWVRPAKLPCILFLMAILPSNRRLSGFYYIWEALCHNSSRMTLGLGVYIFHFLSRNFFTFLLSLQVQNSILECSPGFSSFLSFLMRFVLTAKSFLILSWLAS